MANTERTEDVAESVEDLEARYKALQERHGRLKEDKGVIDAELAARRRSLKKHMDECRSEGFDPDNLQEEIRRSKAVAKLKIDQFEAEIEAGEKMVRPMLEEVRRG